MEAIESELHMQHQPTPLDKHYLGFHHPQPPDETTSLNGDDETAMQIIVEEVQNLVLKQAFIEERSKSEAVKEDEIAELIINEEVRNLLSEEREKGESVNEDEIAVQIINEEVRNLVLDQAFSEERAKGNGGEEVGNQSMKEISGNEYCGSLYEEGDRRSWSECGNGKDVEVGSKEWGPDHYEDGDNSWSECGNGKDGEVGSKEWGPDHYEDGDYSWSECGNGKDGEVGSKEWGPEDVDYSWSENANVVGVENVKGGEAGLNEWGVDHYEDGDRSWRENANVIDVENEKGSEAGLKEWGFNCHDDGDHSWRRNENVVDVENEKGSEAVPKLWGFNANGRGLIFPLRPDAEDCAYYMKTGACKYGVDCKFNHPSPRRNLQWSMEKGKQKEESEERAGQIECKYYLTEGGCKYGNACKYNHSRRKGAISPVLDFNFLGLPIRPAEKDCPYYMRTGSCKYGSNCRFHHPDPTTVAGNNPSFGYNSGGSAPVQSASFSPVSSWSSPRASNETSPFLPVVYTTSQGIPPLGPQWNSFQTPIYPTSEKSLPTPPAFTMNDPATKTNFYPRPQQPWLVEEYYPERPGQPDCSYFIKTGDCKYKANCKFHHPKTQNFKANLSVLSDKGLPLRPGQAVCSFYSRYGICKFGPGCKFDHPENNDHSASPPGFAFY